MTLSLIAAALAGLAVLAVVFGLAKRDVETDEVSRRLSRYGSTWEGGTPASQAPASPREALDQLTSALNRLMSRSSYTGKLAEDLARADLKLKSSEWVLIVAGAGVLLGMIGWLRFGSPIAVPIGLVIAWVGSGIALRLLQGKRTRAFDRQLGDTLTLLSNALRAGYSFAQAISTVSKTASPPMSDEFSRATREIALGVNVDDALNHMVDRNKSEDFDLMVTAVQIQRVVGGNLAEILDTIAHTIRERVRIKGEIRTLTAQARLSGYIITGLPVALAAMLTFIAPDYFKPMLTHTMGQVMLGIGVFSMALGFAIMQKITKIEV